MPRKSTKPPSTLESKPAPAPVGREDVEPAPLALAQVLGQNRAVELLRSAVTSGRVHHAWIFHGPVGVGKMTAALAFAAELLTPVGGPDRDRLLSLLRRRAHPDLHVLTRELAGVSREMSVRKGKQTNIPKAVLEEFLLEPAQVARSIAADTPVGKVFIIDGANLIDPVGQNALLKTLEEPPAGTVLILVTSDESRLLPTIRSRCQRVGFVPLSEADMHAWLKSRRLEVTPAQRDWLVSYAAGSPGLLIEAHQHGLMDWARQLEPLIQQLDRPGSLAPSLGATMSALVEARAADAVSANKDASKDAANRLWCKRLLAFVAEHTRRRLIEQPEGSLSERLSDWLDLLAGAERQLDANVPFASVLENLAAQQMECGR